uniref:Putative secreted protein n=1 Tax=Anopheles marajoara TaxID=58244 RepID=A0A2M4CE19_9DIPT
MPRRVFFLFPAVLFHFRLPTPGWGMCSMRRSRESVSYLVWLALVINFYPNRATLPLSFPSPLPCDVPLRRGSIFC